MRVCGVWSKKSRSLSYCRMIPNAASTLSRLTMTVRPPMHDPSKRVVQLVRCRNTKRAYKPGKTVFAGSNEDTANRLLLCRGLNRVPTCKLMVP